MGGARGPLSGALQTSSRSIVERPDLGRSMSRQRPPFTGRRRRWSAEEKLRIVEESCSGPRMVSATARRYGISNQLLFAWRKARREGRLGEGGTGGFVPAMIGSGAPETRAQVACGRMEVVSANGRRIIVDRHVDVDALLRIVQGLETLGDSSSDRRAGVAGDRPQGHAQGVCEPVAAGTGGVAARPAERAPVLLPESSRQPVEGDLARRPGACLFTKRLERLSIRTSPYRMQSARSCPARSSLKGTLMKVLRFLPRSAKRDIF
jgi:transposase